MPSKIILAREKWLIGRDPQVPSEEPSSLTPWLRCSRGSAGCVCVVGGWKIRDGGWKKSLPMTTTSDFGETTKALLYLYGATAEFRRCRGCSANSVVGQE